MSRSPGDIKGVLLNLLEYFYHTTVCNRVLRRDEPFEAFFLGAVVNMRNSLHSLINQVVEWT